MKRTLCFILSVALIMTMLVIPVAAAEEEWAVDITSISEGETFTLGSDITLTADATTLADTVKNIDFYANGSKIPGTVVGNSGTITWYAPCEGVYDIKTKVTFSGDEESVWGNETVRIVVLPSAEDTKILWAGDSNLQVGSKSSTTASTNYALYGKNSAMYEVPAAGTTKITYTANDIVCDWTRGGVVLYCDGDVGSNTECTVTYNYLEAGGTTEKSKGRSNSATDLKKGYNYISVQAIGTDSTLKSVLIQIKSMGTATPLYVCGILGMKTRTDTVPVASAAIGNGVEGVCNAIGSYRINFDSPILPNSAVVPATVSLDGTAIEGVTYTYGYDYVDLHLPTLDQGKTYTVSIPENTIQSFDGVKKDQYNAKYVAATTFTFSTKNTTCDSATPVVKMSYPVSGETCMGNTGFAAQVLAPSSAISSVEFYNGETKIEGTATKMTNGEWWFEPATDLDAGTYSISAKFLDASSGVLAETSASTYTVTAVPKHYIKGIRTGDVIVAAHESSRTITIVDEANANTISTDASNVQKVEFYNEDDVLLSTDDDGAPYEYNLVFDNYGTHTITAKVYDAFGNVTPYTSTYKVVKGIKNAENSHNEDFTTTTNAADFYSNISSSDLAASIADGKITFTRSGTNTYKQFDFKYAAMDFGTKVYYYEFDLTKIAGKYSCYLSSVFGADDVVLIPVDGSIYGKIGIVIDFNSNYAIIRQDGKEVNRVLIAGFKSTANKANGVHLNIRLYKDAAVSIDNFDFSVYDADARTSFGTGEFAREFSVASGETTKTITMQAINTTDNSETVTNIVAVYGNDNQLLEVPVLDKAVEYKSGDFKKCTYNITLPEGAQTVKVFMWTDLETITPIGAWAE